MALKEPTCNLKDMKMKSNIKRPLEHKTFYLDLKMYPGEAKLITNLKLLGAVHEPFLTCNVSFVVSNRESLKNVPAKTFKVPAKLQNWTPLTPITNTSCPSPLFNASSVDYPNSPASDQNAVPMSYGMAVLQKAVLKKQTHTSKTDVIELCKQWKVKILHVDYVVEKVQRFKSQLSHQLDAERKRSKNGERKLKPPFLKLEDAKRGWTSYREFPSSTFNNNLLIQVKELYNHFKKSGNIEVVCKPVLGAAVKNGKSAQSLALGHSMSKSLSKVSETTEKKPSTAFSVCNGKRKIGEKHLADSKKQKISQARKKKLYCEICKVYYGNLDTHLASDIHSKFMSDPMNFLEIQNIITSLPQKDITSRSSLCTNINNTWEMTQGDSTKVLNSFDYTELDFQGNPTTCERMSAHTGSHFYHSQLLASNSAVPVVLGDLDTEPYSLMEEDYISPSCSSPESSYLPYLEDPPRLSRQKFLGSF